MQQILIIQAVWNQKQDICIISTLVLIAIHMKFLVMQRHQMNMLLFFMLVGQLELMKFNLTSTTLIGGLKKILLHILIIQQKQLNLSMLHHLQLMTFQMLQYIFNLTQMNGICLMMNLKKLLMFFNIFQHRELVIPSWVGIQQEP